MKTKSSIYLWCPKYEHRQDIILCEFKKCKKIKKCEEYQKLKGGENG